MKLWVIKKGNSYYLGSQEFGNLLDAIELESFTSKKKLLAQYDLKKVEKAVEIEIKEVKE